MRKVLVLLSVSAAMVVSSLAATPLKSNKLDARTQTKASGRVMPRYFEENRGQWPADVAFRAYGYGHGVSLGVHGVTLEVADPKAAQGAGKLPETTRPAGAAKEVALRFEGAQAGAKLDGLGELPAKGAWFAGAEKDWRSAIGLYERVRLGQVYPGVDATFYGRDGELEYDLDLAPGAKSDGLVLDLDGADDATVGSNGDLKIEANGQTILLHKPMAWQGSEESGKQPVEVSYALLPASRGHASRVGLKVGKYDAAKALTIDPVLTFATYLTSANSQADANVIDLALDSANNVYVLSTDGIYQSMTVQKFSPAGALVYTATFSSKGTSYTLTPVALRVNASGQAYVAVTASTGYPTTANAYAPKFPNASYGGQLNGALSVISADGSSLVYSTYFGGTANGSYLADFVYGLAVDAAGNAYLGGQAGGGSFPVTAGAYQSSYTNGYPAGFVAKLNPAASGAASLVYSTLLGGNSTAANGGVSVDGAGNAYVGLNSEYCNGPVAGGAYAYPGAISYNCAYVTAVNPTGTGLVYSALLGPGTVGSVVVDGSQNVYAAGGQVGAEDFATTTGAYQTAYPDGFAMELSAAGGLVYSTFLSGPSGISGAQDITIGRAAIPPGCVSSCPLYLSGQTSAKDFPVVNGVGGTPPAVSSGTPVGFLVVLNGTGSAALTSGYLGGLNTYLNDGNSIQYHFPSVAVDTAGNAWLAETLSGATPDFPVTTSAVAGPSGSWLAEVSLTNAGNVVAVPNTIAFGNAVPVNVNSTTWNGAPTSITLRNMGSAPVTLSSVLATPSVFTESDNCDGVIAAAGYCTAQIAFTPATDAAITGALTITSTGINSPLTIPLSGQGSDQGFIQATPSSLSFGNVTLGTVSAPQVVTFTNVGDEPINNANAIYFVNAVGFTEVNNCPYTLTPGASCQAQVTFAPGANQAGPQATTLEYYYTYYYGYAGAVSVTGAGVLPAGTGGTVAASINATTLNFGTVTQGAASTTQTDYLFNVGSQVMSVLTPTITLTSSQGSSADFQINTFGNQTLLENQAATINVTFTPSTATLETATLSIPVLGSATPYTIALVGQGAASTQIVEFSPNNAIYTDQVVGTTSPVQYFYAFNTGSTPFKVDRVLISGDFVVSNDTCTGATLPASTAPGFGSSGNYCYVGVSFTPTQAGARSGTLTVIDAASSTPQMLPLGGNGIAAVGSLSVTPNTLVFGNQVKGTSSATQYVTITNQGNSNVNYTAATTSADYAITYNNCTPFPYGITPDSSSCQVGVTFTPTVSTGPDNGTLTLSSSAGTQTIALTGAGEPATVAGLLSPAAINFGSSALHVQTDWVPVYVMNTGTETLKITTGATVSGNFAIDDTCGPAALEPGQDCYTLVAFNPTLSGARTGTLTYKTNAGTLTASLQGTATASGTVNTYFDPALVSFDQTSINTMSAPITVNFYYNGTSSTFSLNGASITAGSANFQLAMGNNALNTCSANVGSTTSCQVNVVFAPTAAGLQTGTLTVNSSVGPFAVTLSGYSPAFSDAGALSPGALSFASQVVSTTSAYQGMTLTNTGASAFTVGTIGGTNFGPTGEFQVYNGVDECSGTTLATANSQSGTAGSCFVYIQFAPSAAGTRTGTLSVPVTYADGTTGTITANLTGTGVAQKNNAVLSPTAIFYPDTTVGVVNPTYLEYAYLTNSGNLPFTVGTLTGTNAVVGTSTKGDFLALGSPGTDDFCSGNTISPGGSCSVAINFQPSAAGTRTGSITFPVTYANASSATPITLSLSGNGIAANAAVVLNPTSVQFGPVTAGTSTPGYYLPVTVTNTGNVPVIISKYVLSAGFLVYSDGCTGITLNPGSSCNYYPYFAPAASTAGTTINGTLSIYDSATGSPQVAALNGVSIASSTAIAFSQTAVAFGNQLVKTASSQVTIYLVNQGSKGFKIASLALSGVNKSDISESDSCAGATLSAYSYCNVYLTFTPGAAGPRTATLTETDGSGGGARSVTITGTGVVAGSSVVVFPSALAFGTVPVGEGSAQQFFSVTSTGVNPVTFGAGSVVSSDAAEFPVTQDGCSGQTLSTGQACNVGVLFAPSSAGSKTASISVTDGAAGSPQVVAVSGTGGTELTSAVTLTATPASAAFGSVFTLTAAVVDQSGKPLTNGSVTFYDGTTALGTAQVVSSALGGGVVGTATLKTVLAPLGANSITAAYVGGDGSSRSAASVVTVTGQYPTTTGFTSSGSVGNYTFTATVAGGGPVAPTGNVSFTDGTTGLVPGTVALNASTLTHSFVAAPIIRNLPAAQVVGFADLNGDGIPDLVTGLQSGISVQIGNGDGTFQAPVFYYSMNTFGLAFGDFNGDGKIDLAIASNAGVGIALGNGDGTFPAAVSTNDQGSNDYGIAVGDFNGDGKLDIVAANMNGAIVGGYYYNTVDLLLGNGDGTFQPPVSFATPSGTYQFNLTVGDFNGDGKLDVSFGNPYTSSVGTLLGNGNGTFQAIKISPTVNAYPQWVTAADVNGDGKLDLITNDGSNIGVMAGNGDGTFQAEQTVLTGGYYSNPVAVGDVNGDGKVDLVIGDYNVNFADVLIGNGDGTFQNLIKYSTGSYPSMVALADINHDGKLDFVVANNQGGSDTVYLNQVTQKATLANAVVPGTGTHPVTAAYSSDSNYAASTSTALQLTASLVTPSMQLAGVPSATVAWAQPLSVSITLTGPLAFVPAPTGTVSYSIDGGAVQTATLAAGAIQVPISQLSVGPHSIAVSYGGDQYYTTLAAQTLALTVVKASQTIAFGALPSVIYGGAAPALSATATSGLAVSFTVTSGPATISNGVLTITGTGTVVVEADQSGNVDYNAAPAITQKFVVGQAPLTVVVNSASKVYGGALPAFSGTVTGLVNGDTLGGTITATYSSTGTAASGVGSYPITAQVAGTAAGDYAITVTPGTLTVTPAALTLTANSLTGVYGGGLPSLTYTTAGLVNGDTAAKAFTGSPLLSTTATAKSGVGVYPITITAGTLVSANYSVQYVNGTLTFRPAVLTVTPTNQSSVYGAALPTLTYTLKGFVNGDTTATATTGAALLATTATAGSPVGTYAITGSIGTLAAQNYTFSFVPGVLTITKGSLTLTANSLTSMYGATLPTLGYGVSGLVNGDTAATAYTGAPTLTTTATAKSVVGSYAITIGLGTVASSNYSVKLVNGTLTVGQAILTVTANNQNSVYGGAVPALTSSIAGFVNGDTAASAVKGAASIATTATAQSAAGTYPITPSAGTLSAANYTFQFVAGTLTIGQATLTVTANNASSVYGAALPTFGYTLSGFVNGDGPTAVTGSPSLTSTATPASGAGSYTVTPAAGTLAAANYSFAFVPGTLTIAKAPLTITAGNATMIYGGTLPSFSYQATGFVNGDSTSSLTGAPSLTTTAIASSGAGTYPVTAAPGTLASANYSFTFVPGVFTITKAPLVIAAVNASGVYGAALPAFVYSANGLVNGDSATTALTGSPSLTTPATSASSVGAYPITASVGTLAAANYSFSFTPATFTIAKAPLVATATNASSVYGAALPALGYTLSGFVNGDTAAVVAGTAKVTTSAVKGSVVGSYPITITAGTLAATNYSFTLINGSLSITQAPLTVNVNSFTRAYDVANPTLTGVVTGLITGDTLTVTYSTTAVQKSAAGTYPITATVSGSKAPNYNVTVNQGTLTVKQAVLTVTATKLTSVYGAAVPAFTYTITGFVNGDTVASATTGLPSVTSTAVNGSPVGTYPITPSLGTLASTDYTFNFVSSTLTITPATLTVTANNITSVYGAGLLPLTYSFSGFVNGDSAATATTGAPALTTTATASSSAGSYPITPTAGTLVAANYKPVFVAGTYTIGKATLALTANSLSSTYGATLPSLTYTLTGFVNGQTQASATTGAPKLSTTATATANVGAYPISVTAGTLAATNYTFAPVNGTLTLKQAALTVTVNSFSRVYDKANPTFTGTVTGKLAADPLTVTYSTAATVSSPVGTYPITATVTGSKAANYLVTVVPGTLTVTPAGLVVTAVNATSVYGSPLPAFSYTVTGFVNGDTAATAFTGSPSYVTAATSQSPVGKYTVTPAIGSLVAPNYTFTFVAGSLTIGKAVLTVTADNLSTVYGSSVPTLGYTLSGLLNGDTGSSATTGAPTVSTKATSTSPAGTYAISITAGTLAASNYSFQFVPGSLLISKALLTVSANSITEVYGSGAPTFTDTVTGFVNGDTLATAVTGAASLTSTAPANFPVGTYSITAAQGTLGAVNYTFQFTAGTLTITRAALSVIANNISSVYGSATAPALTYSFSGLVNGDTQATAATGAPKLTTTATAASPAGTYPITIALSTLASSNYTITLVNGIFTMAQAPLNIAVNSFSRVYDAANPTLTGTVTGLVKGDTLTVAYTTTATKASAVGTYPITATVTGSKAVNYNVNVVAGVLTITPASLTVTATSVSSVHGATLPAFATTIVGFLNGDTAATAVTGAPAVTTTATSDSPAGTYPITPSLGTLAATNYTFKFVAGTLTISKAALTVSASNAVSVYGSAIPTLTYTITGFVDGDTLASSVTGVPAITTTATAKSASGSYVITAAAGTLASNSYAFVYKPATLTIGKATLTATATNQSITAGSAIPTLTYTLTGFVNSDTQATAVTGTAKLTTTATSASPAGSYPITIAAGTLAAVNYKFVYVNGVLTITQ